MQRALRLNDVEFTDDMRRLFEIPSLQELTLYCTNPASVPELPGWQRQGVDEGNSPAVAELLKQVEAEIGHVCLQRVAV